MFLKKSELSELLYDFLETIYRFEQLETGLFQVSWQEIHLLRILDLSDGLTVGGVAEALRVPLFHASRLVSQLEEKGRLTKTRLAENKRIIRVAISPEGRKLLEAVETYQYELIRENAHVLEPSEFQAIVAGLGKLKQLLNLERGQ
ncbi:MAG: MarR family winged helix-turn-helix transcriptional regulator [Solirubrobacterales bacterium]